MKETYDRQSGDMIEMPNKMMLFLLEIEEVYKKHVFYISHEDIERGVHYYSNIEWLKSTRKDY